MPFWKSMICGAAAAALLCGQAQAATVATKVPAPVAGISTELLALPTPDALGASGPASYAAEPLMAALYNPKSGENVHGPAIVFVDEGPGSHPAMQATASRFAAQRLAAKGYTVISIFPRINRGFGGTPFAKTADDIKAAIDHLEARGHEDIILAGHGIGATAVTLYMATATDELYDSKGNKRVKAAILFAPPTDALLKEGGLDAPGRLDAKVAEARAMIADKTPPADILDGTRAIAHADMVQSPQMFLDYWGPDAKTKISLYLPKVAQPILMLAGTADDLTPPGRLEALKAIATNSAKVDLQWYPGIDHAFDGVQDKVSDDAARWLAAQGLGVKPAVTVEILDARFEDGSVYPGTLYTPAAGGDPRKPAILLQWGTGGDMWHSATQWLAWRLAQEGYLVLSPRSRMGGGVGLQRSTYKEQTADLKAWLDVLEARGVKRVVAEGHSLGGILVSNITVADPRIVGTIYMAPTRDSPVRARDCQGEAHYAKVVAQAQAAVAAGEGRDTVPSYASYPAWCKDSYPEGKGMALSGGGGDTAFHFMDFRSPTALIHTQVIGAIKTPGLAFWADKDGLMTPAFIADFKSHYAGKLDVVHYSGTHGARESKNLISDNVVAWLKRTYP